MAKESRIDEVLTVKEAAARLHIKPATVYDLISEGMLPCRRLGPKKRKILIDASDVEAHWEASKSTSRAPVRMTLRHLDEPK